MLTKNKPKSISNNQGEINMEQIFMFQSQGEKNQIERRRELLILQGLNIACLNNCEEFEHDDGEFWCEIHNCKYYNKQFFDKFE